MVKLSENELQDIIERDAPGSRLIHTVSQATSDDVSTDSGTPDLERLHDKHDSNAAADAPTDDGDVQIVTIGPKEATDPWDRGSAPKSVVISTKTKRIIGRQG